MSAIGPVQTEKEVSSMAYTPQVVIACCVAIAALATLTIALSSWANVKIACMHGSDGIIRHSSYTIMLPLTLVALCGIAIRVLLIDKVPKAPTEHMISAATEVITPNRSSPIVPDLLAPIETIQGSPIRGMCMRILVQVGDVVERHAPICVLEVMKMETTICADTAGTITALHIQQDVMINQEDPLYTILPERHALPAR